MADNLIFPIQFDLEAAVRKAQGDADKYLRQLQTTIHSKPLAIDLKIVNAGSGSLNEISKRIRDIVSEWNNMSEAERIASKTSGEYTDRAKKLIAEFARLTGASETYARSLQQIVAASRRAANEQEKAMEKQRKTNAILLANEKSIANITSKLKYWKEVMNSSDMGSKQFRKAAEEVRRLNQSLGEAQRNVNSLTGQFRKQDGYVSRLVKRLVVYAGFQQINNFLTSVRSVTAEFELQRISLGAIIQDQAKANALFSEIKNFALKSPIKILDLTKYTKQLAAYKIGVNELFDTTKRLADISVGIGVSMDRLILLYGQVRATGYLRASEIRQATEAGIPLVEELANKLSEVNGTLVTSAQVLKMVENRAISFEMVKEVFEDMTNAGGLFYDMQEKQGNTLYGMWQKLGDAAAMMYDEIGNTSWINEGMREGINTLRSLMLNWKQTGAAISTVGVATLLYMNRVKLATLATNLAIAANEKGTASLNTRIAALKRLIAHQKQAVGTTNAVSASTRVLTAVHLRASQAINLVVAGFKKLKAAFMSNIWGIALVGLSLLVEHLLFAKDTAKELKNELANINLDYESKQGQDAANLEHLADAAVNAAKGSKAQKDALEELKNTYGKIIPVELLTIENLERMKGNYGELIALIDEYNLKQKYEKETSAIESSFAPEEEERANKIRNILREGLRIDYADEATGGVFDKVLDLSERNIQRFLLNLKKYAEEGKDKTQQIVLASQDLGKELGLNKGETDALTKAMIELDRHGFEGQGTLMDYTEALYRKNEALTASRKEHEKEIKALNEYSAVVDEVLKKNEEEPEVTANKDEFENEKARLNNQISDVASGIVELLNTANVDVDNGTQQILNTVIKNGGMIPDAVWDILEKAAEAANNPKLLAAIQALRKHYKGLAPDNQTVNFIKDRMVQIVSTMGLKMKEFRQYLWDGQGDVKTYQENLQKSINTLRAQAYEMIKLNALIDAGLDKGQKYDVKEIQTLQAKADALQQLLDTSVTPLVMPDDKKSKSRSTKSTKSDPRLQILNEMVQLAEKLNKEYSDWEKKVGSTQALEKVNATYAETVKYAEKVAKDAGISLPHLKTPTNAKELNEYLEAVRKVMETTKGLKGGKKAAIELGVKMSSAVSAEDQKAIEEKIKTLADRISRTKTAKEFYEKILSQTGDVELAANVTFSIYGEDGKDLKEVLADQVRGMTNGLKLPDNIISAGNIIDYKGLRDWAKANEKELGGMYEKLIKISDDGQKELAKVAEQGAKLLLAYDEIAQKRVNIEQEASEKIRQLREAEALFLASQATKEQKEAYSKRTNKAVAGVEAKRDLDLLKLQDEYLRFFSAIHSLTKKEAEKLRGQVRQALFKAFQDGAISADELKRELKAIDEQFRKLTQDSGKFMDYLEGGFDGLINRLRTMADEMMSVGSEIGKMDSVYQISEGQKSFIDTMLKQFGSDATGNSFASLLSNTNGDLSQMGSLLQGISGEMGAMAEGGASALAIVDRIITDVARTIEGIAAIRDQLNEMRSEDNQLEGGFWDAFEYLENFNKYAAQGWENLKSGNIVGAVQNTIQSIISIFGTAQAQRVRKANKEIKRQQELLDQLEYTYGRLEASADKLFGRDYLNNYNQQLKVLQAQQQAYLKQAEAERSKGKKADKEKIKEYEKQARDTANAIKEMQDDLVAHFTGSSKTDVARQMAKSWIEARASMSDTFAAIKGDYQDLIKNMIVEGAAARVIENALSPLWEQIEDAYKSNNPEKALDEALQGADAFYEAANNGMEVLWKALEARGYDMKQLIGDVDSEYTGIAKNIAGATSEEINTAAAIGNTIMYHTSHLPIISQNVAAIYQQISQGKSSAFPDSGAAGWTDWQRQAMENYNAIARNTAATVVECKRAADACAAATEKLNRAFRAKGATSGFNVFLNS